jgi:hypothetical protein
VEIRHHLTHVEHHLLVAINACGLATGPIMIEEIRRHILADHSRVAPVYKVFEVVSRELLHLFRSKRGGHVFAPEEMMSTCCG